MGNWSDKAKSGASIIEGKITDYTFMDTFPFGDGDDSKDAKKGSKEKKDNIYMLLEITPDGADEPVQRSLYLGSGEYLRIEEDGKTLVSADEDGTPRLYDKGEVMRFVESLEKEGFPAETRFPDINEAKVIDFRGLIGWRLRLTNEIDEEAQIEVGRKRLGSKAAAATREQLLDAGKRLVTKGKHKGKKFNLTRLIVTKVFGEDEDAETPQPKAGKGKTNGKVNTRGSSRDEDNDDADADTGDSEEPSFSPRQADKFLVAVLKSKNVKGGTVKKVDLALAITRYAGDQKMDTDERDEYRRYFSDADNLVAAADRGSIEYNEKKAVVSLA